MTRDYLVADTGARYPMKNGTARRRSNAPGSHLDTAALFGHRLLLPELGGVRARSLMIAFDSDRVHSFREGASAFPRTRAASAGLAVLVDHFLTPARAAGLIDDEGAYCVFLATLFIVVVDDHFDDVIGVPTSEGQIDQYVARLLFREGEWGKDAPSVFLAALLKRLQQRAGWARFGALFVEQLEAMIRGMAYESKERGGFAPAPNSFEEYLLYASGSMGLGVGLAAALVVIDDPTLEERTTRLRDLYRTASRIARVANDLRSSERERGERKSTVIAVAARHLGIPNDRVDAEGPTLMAAIQALAQRDLEDLRRETLLIGSASGVPEEMAIRAVTGLLAVYEVADLHELP
jgi:hypothetical protein